jgi:hypothetical protein
MVSPAKVLAFQASLASNGGAARLNLTVEFFSHSQISQYEEVIC